MITAAVIAAVLIHYDIHELTITGNISAGLPPFRLPSFSLDYGNGTGRVHKNFGDIISVSTDILKGKSSAWSSFCFDL